MADKGIIFSPPMVRALLEGRKTQTRRLIAQPPAECSIHYMLGNESWLPAEKRTPFRHEWEAWTGPLFEQRPPKHMCGSFTAKIPYAPGDRLYVREACLAEELGSGEDGVRYLADNAWFAIKNTTAAAVDWVVLNNYGKGRGKGVPSIHMPRWASRLWLQVTDVRVQRVAEISEVDAKAEGLEQGCVGGLLPAYRGSPDLDWRIYPDGAFGALWDSLHAKPGETWADNPWIVAVTFDVHRGNIDRSGDA